MEPVYVQNFTLDDRCVDRYGRMKPSTILYLAQEMGGRHSALLSLDYDALASRRLFWAVHRHGVQITRMPMLGETIRVETWPMPATKVAYPRSVIAYDEENNECFRAITLWVLMDMDTRKAIQPGKSGLMVPGTLRGNELPVPKGLAVFHSDRTERRRVSFTDLDRNGHMNNTRCMDWVADLMPSEFHKEHEVKEFAVGYHEEALEQQELTLKWDQTGESQLQVDALFEEAGQLHRVFSVKLSFE